MFQNVDKSRYYRLLYVFVIILSTKHVKADKKQDPWAPCVKTGRCSIDAIVTCNGGLEVPNFSDSATTCELKEIKISGKFNGIKNGSLANVKTASVIIEGHKHFQWTNDEPNDNKIDFACNSSKLVKVDLKYLENLHNLPKCWRDFAYIKEVNVEDTKILSLDSETFKSSALVQLEIKNSRLESVPDIFFNKEGVIEKIILDGNYIDQIEIFGDKSKYANFQALILLSLKNNRITTLKNGTFEKLTKLESLDLDGNPIEAIEPDAFKSVAKTLKILNLSKTKIKQTTVYNSFFHLDKLEHLYLQDTLISTIDLSYVLGKLKSLKNLNMANSQNLKRLEALLITSTDRYITFNFDNTGVGTLDNSFPYFLSKNENIRVTLRNAKCIQCKDKPTLRSIAQIAKCSKAEQQQQFDIKGSSCCKYGKRLGIFLQKFKCCNNCTTPASSTYTTTTPTSTRTPTTSKLTSLQTTSTPSITATSPTASNMPMSSTSQTTEKIYHPTKAVVILSGTSGVSGTVTFEQTDNAQPVKISGQITGLTAGLHGFHVHQYGNLTNACTSAGSHFNPMAFNHSSPDSTSRHAGDLGNILANAAGTAIINITDRILSLSGRNSVLGRAVVVHANVDDLGLGGNAASLTTGNAGSRLACGVVGLAEEIAT